MENNYKIVTAKDLAVKLNCSIRQAYRYLTDIKEEYKLRTKPTWEHINKYFSL